MLRRAGAIAGLVLSAALSAAAQTTPLLCFGNEPSWSVELREPGVAHVRLPDESPVEYRGSLARMEWLRESAWRGKPASGAGGDLVVFLRETSCSDGMSDTQHPVDARAFLPGGRFLAGCCRVAAAQAGAMPGSAPALEGRAWRVETLPGQDPKKLAALRPALNVRFEAGRVTGFSGCNRFTGGYTLAGERIQLGPLAGTMMACDEPVMEIETAFRSLLSGEVGYAVAEGALALTSETGATAKLREQPAPRLEGVTWEVTGYNNGRQAVVSPKLGTALTLSFQDGAVTGSGGCNQFRAPYTQEGSRVTIGAAVTTRKACPGEGVMQQEREFLAALEAARVWTIRDEMLDMHFEDGATRALTARAK